ncbi:19586_t:CDS:2, partial [Funneliformis geosporum]
AMPDKYFGFGKQAKLGFQFVSSFDKQGFSITEVKTGSYGKLISSSVPKIIKQLVDDGHNVIIDEVECELSLMEEREMLRGDRSLGLAHCGGQLLVIPNKEKFTDNSEKFVPVGTLAKISLDISTEADPELVINSLKEIQLRELDEESLDKLTEKFVRHLPDILEKSKLSSVEKLPYMTMMR